MNSTRILICSITAALLALGGCATAAEEQRKRQEMEADIDDILSLELDPAEYGEPKNCLSDSEYRSYRALGKRHLLFQGRKDKLWVNVLRGRCPNLDEDSTFIITPNMSGRLCDTDRFRVVDRLDSLSRASTAPTCVLGEFKPVTEDQVTEIEYRLEVR